MREPIDGIIATLVVMGIMFLTYMFTNILTEAEIHRKINNYGCEAYVAAEVEN